MTDKIPIICIVGPTASGKTSLSVDIAEKYGGEIISADSMQIYKGIHIASAAPDKDEMRGIPHHLIEFLEPDKSFTVAEYVDIAKHTVEDIFLRGKLPVLVGGTGLYIDSLIDNITFTPNENTDTIRSELYSQMEIFGADAMLERLKKIDPKTAEKLHPNNTRRIIRALEVFEQTGKTFSELNAISRENPSPYNPLFIGINFRDRNLLYSRIEKRIDIMISNGLLEEAKTAFLSENKGAGQAIGHKELFPAFWGDITIEDAVNNLKTATRRYAKRQLTWFKRNENINWIYADETDDVSLNAYKIIDEWRKIIEN